MSQDTNDLPIKIQLLKLKRINELNEKLKGELQRDRITASNACLNLIDYTTTNKDFTLPEIWGYPKPGENPFRDSLNANFSASKRNINTRNNYNTSNGCCNIM